MNQSITAVEGISVGHADDRDAVTGCTVILLEAGSIVACDVRGGYPGTYDTHSIEVTKTFIEKQAIFLVGGDIFGLDASIGVRRYLIEKGLASKKGFAGGKMPFIVGANIYDMKPDVGFGDIEKLEEKGGSYSKLGYEACVNASAKTVEEGNIGAGIGATVGHLKSGETGMKYTMKGGVGSSSTLLKGGIVVGALIVTNSFGNIYDVNTGKTVAGTRRANGKGFLEMRDVLDEYLTIHDSEAGATTIGVVVTNVSLNHEQLIKVAEISHNGLAMSIRPTHTSRDGDTLFAVSTRKKNISSQVEAHRLTDIIGYLAAEQVAAAVINSVHAAKTLNNVPGLASAQ